VHLREAKALKGNRSRSFQLVTPDTVGTEHLLLTYVEVLPGGSTPPHEHGPEVESVYFILEGRGEVTSDRQKKSAGPNTAIFFPMGSKHGIRNAGRTKLKYLSIHTPPYDIERLYKTWEGALLVLGG
jgi:putative monooxygenase